MLLRASGEGGDGTVDPSAVTRGEGTESGVRGGAELLAFAEAAVRGTDVETRAASARVQAALGEAALVDAAAVVGNFERMVRIADGTGIPLDRPVALLSADVRATIGIDAFGSASETPPVVGWQRLVGRVLARMMPLVLRVMGRRRRGG